MRDLLLTSAPDVARPGMIERLSIDVLWVLRQVVSWTMTEVEEPTKDTVAYEYPTMVGQCTSPGRATPVSAP